MTSRRARILGALGAPERQLLELLEQHAQRVSEALDLFDELVHHHPERGDLVRELTGREEQVAQGARELMRRLNERFVTPIEPEDLTALIATLAALASGARTIAERLCAFGLGEVREHARRLAHTLREAGGAARAGVANVRHRRDLIASAELVRQLASGGQQLVREGIADLYQDGPSPPVLVSWTHLYEQFDAILTALYELANTLEAIDAKGI